MYQLLDKSFYYIIADRSWGKNIKVMAAILITNMEKFCIYLWFCLYGRNARTYYVTINYLATKQTR